MRTRDGRIITGVNIDAYLGRIAVCAEAIAIGRAITEHGDHGIETIVAVRHPKPGEPGKVAVVSPCGICRELIHDYDAKAKVIVPDNGQRAEGRDHRGVAAEQIQARQRMKQPAPNRMVNSQRRFDRDDVARVLKSGRSG